MLGPKAASDSGKPSAEARRYIDETTGPDKPRTNRNAVVLAVASRDGIEAARTRIKEYLGWEEVRSQLKDQLKGQDLDRAPRCVALSKPQRLTRQDRRTDPAGLLHRHYSLGEERRPSVQNQCQRRAAVREDKRGQALTNPGHCNRIRRPLPGGPYDLWREGETSRRLNDLVGAFALSPQLPKMLNRKAILDTLLLGCRQGEFVLRVTRPDRSVRTFWRQEPDERRA